GPETPPRRRGSRSSRIGGRSGAPRRPTSAGSLPATRPPRARRNSRGSSRKGYNPPSVAGGGCLRTGCGPGPLEPDLDNSSEGNATRETGRLPPHPPRCGFVFSMNVMVNGKPMELPEGLTIDGLLARLNVRREYTAVAVNREV